MLNEHCQGCNLHQPGLESLLHTHFQQLSPSRNAGLSQDPAFLAGLCWFQAAVWNLLMENHKGDGSRAVGVGWQGCGGRAGSWKGEVTLDSTGIGFCI